jgi:hypothetical protein
LASPRFGRQLRIQLRIGNEKPNPAVFRDDRRGSEARQEETGAAMPYCEVDRYQNGDKWEGVRLFYRRYGRGATKVLLVVGTGIPPRSPPPSLFGCRGIFL